MDPKTNGDASRNTPDSIPKKSRRGFLKQGAALVTGAASAGLAQGASAQGLAGQPWERVYGAGFTGYGQPSRFEQPVMRHIGRPYGDLAPGSGAALAPIESLEGIITPSGLHNNRSHSGTPDIDPKLLTAEASEVLEDPEIDVLFYVRPGEVAGCRRRSPAYMPRLGLSERLPGRR